MQHKKSTLLKTFIASAAFLILLAPLLVAHAAIPSFNYKDPANDQKFKAYVAEIKSQKQSIQKPLSLNENLSGTIKSITGTTITVTVDNPEAGQPATVTVHTSSAKVSRAATHVDDKKTAPGPTAANKKLNSAPKGSKHATRATTAVSAGLAVGDRVNISGTKNTDGTVTARQVSAHAKKSNK